MDLGLLDGHRLLVGALARAETAGHLAVDAVGAEPVLPEQVGQRRRRRRRGTPIRRRARAERVVQRHPAAVVGAASLSLCVKHYIFTVD